MKIVYMLGIIFASFICSGMELERKTTELNQRIAEQIKLFSDNSNYNIIFTLNIINNIQGNLPGHLLTLFHENHKESIKKNYIEIFGIPEADQEKMANEYYKHLQHAFDNWVYNLPEITDKKELTQVMRKLNEFYIYLADCS